MEKVILTRKEFYDLVWKEPLSSLAKKYAMSDNGFRKLCKRQNIPIPKNGHWQKIKFDKPVKIEKLPPDFTGTGTLELHIRGEGNEWNVDQTPLTILTKQIKSDPNAPLVVPDELKRPDKLTIATKAYWKLPERDFYQKGNNMEILPIYVEKNNKKRALLFMDTLVKLMRYRGHNIVYEYHQTMVDINGIRIPFRLREATKRVPAQDSWRTADYIPTGVFILKTGQFSSDKEWRDGNNKIEDQLAKIMAKLELDAENDRKQQELNRIYRERYDAEQKQRDDLRKRREEELNNFTTLLKAAERHGKAIALRTYIKAFEDNATSNNSLTAEIISWISWAKNKADWYDPLVNKDDEFLNDSHK